MTVFRLLPLLLLPLAQAEGQQVAPEKPVTSFLVPGTYTVELMELSNPPEIQNIIERINRAVKDWPDWYLTLQRQTLPGQKLPYDARFGVTETEYKRLDTAKPILSIKGCGTFTLRELPGNGQVYLRGGPGLEGLNGVSFRPRSKGNYQLSTPVGTAGRQRFFTTPADNVLGELSGYRWSLGPNRFDPLNDQQAHIELSRMKNGGKLLLGYRLLELRDGKPVRNVNLLLREAACQP